MVCDGVRGWTIEMVGLEVRVGEDLFDDMGNVGHWQKAPFVVGDVC